MKHQSMTLNIWYDAPKEIWDKIPGIYRQLEPEEGQPGTPYWFSTDESEKHIWASVEPGGLLFEGLMDDDEWATWVRTIKEIATQALHYKVGEVAWGEVDE